MKNSFVPVIVASLLLAGCSAAYKTGQTPDDVYYSSGPAVTETARNTPQSSKQDNSYQSYWNKGIQNETPQSYASNEDDAYLRMKVRSGGRWNSLDDMDYWYGYNGGCNCNSSWGIFNTFNSFNRPWGFNSYAYTSLYNPWSSHNWYNTGYYYPVVIVNKRPVYTNSSRPGLTGYSNNAYDRGLGNGRRNAQPLVSSPFRTIFSGSNNRNNNNGNSSNTNYDRPTRTFTPSTNTNSSSGGSSGSSRTSSGSSSSSGRGGRGG